MSPKTAQRWRVLGGIAVLLGMLFFVGDIYHDLVIVPQKAVAQCGEGNVKQVSTRGFYRLTVSCQP